jgi:hypothetical protein
MTINKWGNDVDYLGDAAQTILDAGCSGVPQLTWNLRMCLDGKRPDYAAGDAWADDAELYKALEAALVLYAKYKGGDEDSFDESAVS